MTRYELAQIVARLMAKEDEYSTSQRAIIEKLACALADELDNMGVRVSTLESRIGNVRWSGDARMRMVQGYDWERKTVPLMAGCASALMQRSMIPPM